MAKISELERWIKRQKEAISSIRGNATYFREASLGLQDDKQRLDTETVAGHSERLAKQLDKGVDMVQAYVDDLKKIN